MSRGLLIKACLLLVVSTHSHAQYDFFQGFNAFLQPFSTPKPKNDVTRKPETKHRQTTKQKYQDFIFFDNDDSLKQRQTSRTVDPFNIFHTTAKPKRKSTKSTTSHNLNNSHTTSKPKLDNSNKFSINNDRNNQETIIVSGNNRESNKDSRAINNARRIDNFNNAYDNNGYNNYNLNSATTKATNVPHLRPTTQRTTKSDYNKFVTNIYGDRTTQRPYNNDRFTTKNPLLNRPGVKPAAVDENLPPITNRPVTSRPSSNFWPITRPPVNPRPVNTRPPFEVEKPISTGVARPFEAERPIAKPSYETGRPVSNENTEIDIEIGPDEDDMGDAEKRRLYEICERKCDEYKAMRVRKVVALPLAAGQEGVEVNVSSCTPDTAPLIIGGQVARIETFPHMALLGWKNLQSQGYKWKCGGSLLSERYVLTAGHCTYHDKDYEVVSGPPSAVQLGSSVYDDSSATVVQVTLVVRHPKYKLRRSYYDVALLKLAVDVTFSETIMPACLGVPPPVGDPVVATGWGKTEYGGDSSLELRSVSIPVWDMNDCRDIWGTSLKLPNGPMPDNQICAGEKRGAKDTCQGDSGGPAQVRDGCAWRVVAVTSVGRSCGAPETPALYARVPRAFIAKQVFTNIKPGRDGIDQYGNQGSNNNNWNNNYYQPDNRGVTTSLNQFNNNNNNNNNFDNNRRPANNNGQYYGNNQDSVSNTNNGNSNNNNWGVTTNNGYNHNNRNNYGSIHNQNPQTTSGYHQSFGQNNNYNVNNNNNQNSRNTDNPSSISYEPQNNNGYNNYNNGYNNNNGRTDNIDHNDRYNRDHNDRYNSNGFNAYPGSTSPWWTK